MSFTYMRKQHPEQTSGPASAEVREDPREEIKEQAIRTMHMWRGRAHKEDPMSSIDDIFSDEYSAADLLGDRKLLGMKHAGPGLVGAQGKPVEQDQIYSIGKEEEDEAAQNKKKRCQGIAREVKQRADMNDSFVPADGDKTKLRKFEEIGLRKGKLSASVLKGTSKMMLFSCLKRTYRVGDGEPEHERKIFESKGKPCKGPKNSSRDFDTSLNYTKGYPRSAVALTIQANRSAFDTIGQLRDLVDRGNEASFTLWKSMPFLSTKQEEEVLNRYKKAAKLMYGEQGKEEEVAALERSISYLEKVIQRKVHAQVAFAHKLKDVARQAETAAMIFSDDGLLKQLEEGLLKEVFPVAAEGSPPPKGENPFENGLTSDNERVAVDKSSKEASVVSKEERTTEGSDMEDAEISDVSGS